MKSIQEFKKIKERVFKPVRELDAEIRTIENDQYEDGSIYWIVNIGLCESMGEHGYIYTLFYDEKPDEGQIIEDMREHIKEQITTFKKEFVLSGTEERQLETLQKVQR